MSAAHSIRYTLKPTHVRDIRAGDTVEIDGQLRTVCAASLKRDPFMGVTLWGDSYALGHRLVAKAVIFSARPAHADAAAKGCAL